MLSLPRLIGAATVAYSATTLVRPAVFAKPCGLTNPDGTVPPAVAQAIRAIGVRDIVVSLLMVTAPKGPALDTALKARVVSDFGDAVVFGMVLKDPRARAKVVAIPVGWGLLAAWSRRLA